LSEHFHTLFTTEASIDALKQTVLQLGVMGKLVEQVKVNEPAHDYLHKLGIKSEPHHLLGWATVPLGGLGNVLGGATPSKANPANWIGDIPWVSPKDMKRPLIADAEDHVSVAAVEGSALKFIPANSILMVVRGMILAHSFPVALTARIVTINQDMKALVPPPEVALYLLLYLQASKGDMVALVDRSSHGTCKLISEKLWSSEVKVPPLAEQHRIVAKVTELLALCDQLKLGLAAARQHHAHLAAVLVEQAVAT
jgi:type I restriction enzyme S subunit